MQQVVGAVPRAFTGGQANAPEPSFTHHESPSAKPQQSPLTSQTSPSGLHSSGLESFPFPFPSSFGPALSSSSSGGASGVHGGEQEQAKETPHRPPP